MITDRAFGISLNLLLAITLALCIVRLWLMPLPSSFWVDEMGTVFVVHHGASDPTLRAAPQVADSIYYVLPKIAEKLGGLNEISYRFFSVLAIGGSLLAIAGIAARLIDPRAAWFAVFGCIASRNFNYQASDARPYALGTLVLACAVYLLIRWLDSGRARDGVLFAIAAALLWWVHLIFWPFYILFAVYASFRVATAQTRASWIQSFAVFSAVAIAIIPVALRSLTLLSQATAHVIVPPPVWADLGSELKLSMITGACTSAFLLSRYFGWKSPRSPTISSASIVLIAGWWLIDPVTLFAFSRITGSSVFVPRYMFLAIPGVSLAALLMVALIVPATHWKKVALFLGVAVLIFSGHWGHLWPVHQNSGWKAAAETLRDWTAGADVPVICPSPFIEARPPTWSPDYPVSGFLYSHLSVYPMSGHVYPFPFDSSPRAEAYAGQLSLATLSRAPRFAIYGGDRSVGFWSRWLAERPELEHWDNKILGSFGDVQIVVFSPHLR